MTTALATYARTPVRWIVLFHAGLVAVPLLVGFLISPSFLITLGFDYILPGGSPIQKIHPATYLACLSLAIFFFTGYSRPIIDMVWNRHPSLLYYFVAWFATITYAALFLTVPFVLLIDTFLLPPIVMMLFVLLTIREKWLVARIIDAFMLANSLLGLVEAGTNWRFAPLNIYSATLGQLVYPVEWRATAFIGHPLTNAYVTGAYILSIIVTRRIGNLAFKLPLIGIHMLALFAFGSRGATGILVAFLALWFGVELFKAAQTRKINKEVLTYLGLAIPAVVIVIPAILFSGFADRFLDRFTNDHGSAASRTIALDLLSSFDLSDLIVGPPGALTIALLKRYNIIAIENMWLNFLLSFGIIGCLLFLPALFWFIRCVGYYAGRQAYLILFYLLACCTTSLGLATKTLMLAFVVSFVLTNLDYTKLLRRPGRGSPRRVSPGALLTVAGAEPV